MNPILFFSGSRTVWTDAENSTALLDICLRYGVTYTDFFCGGDGSIRFCTSAWAAKRLERLCQREGVELRTLESGGLPSLMWRYRRRAGLFVGAILAAALLWLSGRFVWDVRVTGNATMTRSEVLDELRACGFGVGSYIPSVRASVLENRVLIESDRISWIAISIDGTVARVQIIEHTAEPPSEDLTRPANLIAACDGQIELLELYRGNCVVGVGQAVKKGELLVSGLYDSALTGYRWTRASGKVMARTERTFCVEIPLQYEEKVYGERKCDEMVLNFFDFSLKIFKSTGNEGGKCDIIKEEKGLELFGVSSLPFGFDLTYSLPYTSQAATRTPEAALELAYAELERQMSVLSDGCELLRKDVSTTLTEDSLILTCTVLCIEDIAVQSEFEITEQP